MSYLVSLSGWVRPHLCTRGIPLESPKSHCRIFSTVHLGNEELPQGFFSIDILCGHKTMASSQVVSWVSSSRAVTSTSRSLSSDGCQQPQQILWLHSLCPAASTWANVLSYRYGWWSLPGSHQGSSSKIRFKSNLCSASQTEMSIFIAQSPHHGSVFSCPVSVFQVKQCMITKTTTISITNSASTCLCI